TDHHGGRGMDVSPGVRRGSLGRWGENGTQDRLSHRSAGLWAPPLSDPFQCRRAEVGALCRVGLGRQWRDPAADQAFSRAGDQRRAITAADCCKVRRATSPTLIVIFKLALFLRCPAFLTKVFK